MNFCGGRQTSTVPVVIRPWFPITDTRITAIKAAGTLILLDTGVVLMPGVWNGTNWVTESDGVLDDPWKWMFMPEPI